MLDAEVILTSAIEVAIGIAGFSGVVIAIARDSRTPYRKFTVSALLLTSLVTVIFSFVPMLLMNSGLAENMVWAASSSLFFAYFVALTIVRIRQMPFKQWPLIVRIIFPIIILFALLQIPNIFMLQTSWPYLSILVVYLGFSFAIFVSLLWDLWEDPDAGQPGDEQ